MCTIMKRMKQIENEGNVTKVDYLSIQYSKIITIDLLKRLRKKNLICFFLLIAQ